MSQLDQNGKAKLAEMTRPVGDASHLREPLPRTVDSLVGLEEPSRNQISRISIHATDWQLCLLGDGVDPHRPVVGDRAEYVKALGERGLLRRLASGTH